MVLALRGVTARLGAYGEREDGWAEAVALYGRGWMLTTPGHVAMSEDIFGYHSSGEILAPVGRGWDIAKHPTIHPTTKNPPGQTVSSAEAENARAADEDPSARH